MLPGDRSVLNCYHYRNADKSNSTAVDVFIYIYTFIPSEILACTKVILAYIMFSTALKGDEFICIFIYVFTPIVIDQKLSGHRSGFNLSGSRRIHTHFLILILSQG